MKTLKTLKKKQSKKAKNLPEETKAPLYPCETCGFKTNGDFWCKCGSVLCESHSDGVCPSCEDRKHQEDEKRADMAEHGYENGWTKQIYGKVIDINEVNEFNEDDAHNSRDW